LTLGEEPKTASKTSKLGHLFCCITVMEVVLVLISSSVAPALLLLLLLNFLASVYDLYLANCHCNTNQNKQASNIEVHLFFAMGLSHVMDLVIPRHFLLTCLRMCEIHKH
jgi:hypothetical protein